MTDVNIAKNTPDDRVLTLSELIDNDLPALDLWLGSSLSQREKSSELSELNKGQLTALLERFGASELGRVLAVITPALRAQVVLELDTSIVNDVLAGLLPNQVADSIRTLAETDRRSILDALPRSIRAAVETILQWEPESAGANMTPSFLMLPAATSVTDALIELRTLAKSVEAAAYVYLSDGEGSLTGAVSIRAIVTSAPGASLSDLSVSSVHSVGPTLDRELAANLLIDHELAALPVVQDGQMLGVITADRAVEIMDAETTEDFHRLGSAGSLTHSLKSASIWVLYRSRVGWLVALVFGNIFSGAGIAHYEDLIESAVSLVFFLPLLVDSGGNAGSQAATLMVRGLATGDVVMRDWFRLLGKELLVALLLGLSMAIAVSTIGIVRGGPEIALVVSITMIIIVVTGSVIGMSLPFLLNKLRLDPASASAPLITSICDGVGVLIYFAIASQLLL